MCKRECGSMIAELDANTSEKEIIENISSIPGRGNIDEPGGLKEGRQPELDFLANPLCLELEKTINWLLKRPRRGVEDTHPNGAM